MHGAHLEGYRIELLSSLTKLAIKSVILIPEQVPTLFTLDNYKENFPFSPDYPASYYTMK